MPSVSCNARSLAVRKTCAPARGLRLTFHLSHGNRVFAPIPQRRPAVSRPLPRCAALPQRSARSPRLGYRFPTDERHSHVANRQVPSPRREILQQTPHVPHVLKRASTAAVSLQPGPSKPDIRVLRRAPRSAPHRCAALSEFSCWFDPPGGPDSRTFYGCPEE